MSALPANAQTFHGYVYVIEFSNSTIKVGQTITPQNRFRSHSGAASKFGVSIVRSWFSKEHQEYKCNEQALISHMKMNGVLVAGNEYYSGYSFEDSVSFARSMQFSTISASERAEREEWIRANARPFFGEGVYPDIPLMARVIFSEPSRVLPSEADMGEGIDMAMVEDLADVVGVDIDEILSDTYLDMMGRIVHAQVSKRIHELNIWAIKHGRGDLLATYGSAVAS